MVFSSITFLLYFFPLFLITYYFSPQKFKNYIILAFSVFFYSWGAPKFVFILLASTYIDFYIVKHLFLSQKLKIKKILLACSLATNLGLLAYFKYANFFVDNFNVFMQGFGFNELTWTKVILPIGISFYTFQTLTYSIDVYRGVHKPLKKVSDYILYIIMFPQLIAGPIVRFNLVADQITQRNETYEDRVCGFFRFCIGLGKKVLIANVLGQQADLVMSLPNAELDSLIAWIGIVAYTFQIYFDFSGYSDMAIGIGRMIGFKFPENFNNPYISQSITEFWRRWHITLGNWMKDYLYIPLGGNRVKSNRRLYFNLWFVFLLSGLWHGASWNFVIWGAYHGLFLILERIFLLRLLDKAGKFVKMIYCFFIVVNGWVIFRIESFGQAMNYYKQMYAFEIFNYKQLPEMKFFVFLALAVSFSLFTLFPKGKEIHNKVFHEDYSMTFVVVMSISAILLLFLSVSSITTTGFNPFIYFRF